MLRASLCFYFNDGSSGACSYYSNPALNNRYSCSRAIDFQGDNWFTAWSVVPGERITFDCDADFEYDFAFWFLTPSGVEKVNAHQNLSSSAGIDRIDTGWLDSGTIYTVPENAQCLWLNFRRSDNADLPNPKAFSFANVIFLDRSSDPPASSYNPQISASQFSVTSTTFTSQVFLTGLDPSKTYRPYWSLYEQSDLTTVISQGYSNQIGDVTGVEDYTGYSRIVDLKPETEYLINWNLYEVGSFPIPTASEVRFTTLSDGSSGGGSGTTDDSGGILLLILNKVSAILDAMNSGQSEGILSSVDEKLEALIDTLANPEEQQLEDNFKGSLTEVNNNFFGDTAKGQAVTSSDVGNLADTQDTVKNIFQSDYTVTDFFGLFSDNSFFGWFSAETAMDLNPISYGGVSVVDMDDPYNMQAYYENLEKVRHKK